MNYKVLKHEKIIGLTEEQAEENYFYYGPNELKLNESKSKLKLFLGQFKNIFVLILFISTIVLFFMGQEVEAISIIIVTLINAIFGFLEEYKTKKSIMVLQNFSLEKSKVLRDKIVKEIETRFITIKDVILLEAGDKVQADGFILEASNIEVDESMVTGEISPVTKMAVYTDIDDERKSYLYSGTILLSGKCKMVVQNIGVDTKIGQIIDDIRSVKPSSSPLEHKLIKLSKKLGIGCILICIFVSLIGIFRGEDILDMLILGMSLAVAVIPEGLVAVTTIIFSLSIRRLIKKNVLIKKVICAETLGAVKVICTGKTGIVTQNKMVVKSIVTPTNTIEVTGDGYFAGGDFLIDGIRQDIKNLPNLERLVHIATLCNSAGIINNTFKSNRDRTKNTLDFIWETAGSPTEIALLVMAAKVGILKEEVDIKRKLISELPFNSERKMMSIIHSNGYSKIVSTKGAIEYILKKCNFILKGQEVLPLSEQEKSIILKNANKIASDGFRILGFSYKETRDINYEEQMIYVGFVTIMDLHRDDIRSSVSNCYRAGIRPVMVTGDNLFTAQYIAKKVDIYKEGDRSVTGEDLDKMSDDYLKNNINGISVFARVKAKDKLRIVKAFKSKGNVVAITGNGVNDTTSIKEADIGIGMGISGTDITKEVSDIIIIDDNFNSIVNAILEGRNIYQNIRKFVRYLLTKNIGELCTMVVGLMMGMPIVLLPIHILLINLVTDTLPTISLGFEPASEKLMVKKPRKKGESIFSQGLLSKIISRGLIIGLSSLGSFSTIYNMTGDLMAARTSVFLTLIFTQLIYAFECKSEESGILNINIFDNLKLMASALISVLITLFVIYIPFLNGIFMLKPLNFLHILICFMYVCIGPIISYIFNK